MFGRIAVVVAGGALAVGAGVAPAAAAATYGPWHGSVQLTGPVPGGDYPGSSVTATYTLGQQSAGNPSGYAASISWSVSGSGNTHQCNDGTTADYSYSGTGTAAGGVQVSYGNGAYSILASTSQTGKFTITDGCTGQTAGTTTTQLGPATRSYPSAQDDRTTLSAVRQTGPNDSWTVYYNLNRTKQTASPTPTTTHAPSPTPSVGASATASVSATASASASASATSSATPHRHRHRGPATGATATPTPAPSPSESAAAPVGGPAPPPSSGGSTGYGTGPGESGLARHVADYSQVPKDTRTLLLDAVLALILALMLLFPAELFNGTLMENYDEVRGWFGPLGRLGSGLEEHPLLTAPALRWLGVGAFVAVTAGIYALVDPEIGLNAPSFRLFVALALGLVAMTVLANGAALLFVRWRYGVGGKIRLRPGTLVVALTCVLLSRAVHLQPGYVYGIVAGFVFTHELDRSQEGRAVAAWAGWLFAMSIGAWLLIEPARHLVENHEGAFLPLVAEEVTVALTVEGLTILLLALAPIRFLHGERLLRWNRGAWLGTYALAIFAFFAIHVHPEWAGTEATVPVRVWLVLFLAFGAVSVTFWSYFRFRHPREAESEYSPGP